MKTFVNLTLRVVICVGVTWVGVVLLGLIGYPLTAPIWGLMLAKPIVEFFPAFGRLIHWHAHHEWEGKTYKYNGRHLRVYFDGDHAWFVAKDVLRVLDKKEESWLDTRFARDEYDVIPARRDKGFSPEGVVKLTHISGHPEAAKFRLWFERAVVYTLARQKAARDAHGSP